MTENVSESLRNTMTDQKKEKGSGLNSVLVTSYIRVHISAKKGLILWDSPKLGTHFDTYYRATRSRLD